MKVLDYNGEGRWSKNEIMRRYLQYCKELNVSNPMDPHEYKQYAKLLKRIGVGQYWDEIESRINHSNEYVMRYFNYLKDT